MVAGIGWHAWIWQRMILQYTMDFAILFYISEETENLKNSVDVVGSTASLDR